MTDHETKIIIGSLLHDIGKVVYRKVMDGRKHSQSGYEYLKNYTLKKIKKQKPTIKEFSSTHKGTYIVKSSGHLVAIENGNYFDCWDSGNLKIYKYWTIKE